MSCHVGCAGWTQRSLLLPQGHLPLMAAGRVTPGDVGTRRMQRPSCPESQSSHPMGPGSAWLQSPPSVPAAAFWSQKTQMCAHVRGSGPCFRFLCCPGLGGRGVVWKESLTGHKTSALLDQVPIPSPAARHRSPLNSEQLFCSMAGLPAGGVVGVSPGCGTTDHPSALQVSLDFVTSGDYALERMGVTYPAQAHVKSPFDPDNKRVKGIY